ncbi:hypothetical protein Scep_021676 [Stephania cephalantha]|uniref:Uncharacterized protein n=1 Tax=Stephania cephalantha TaxID=152367 RepID=A0AAP0I0F0_9MAGN
MIKTPMKARPSCNRSPLLQKPMIDKPSRIPVRSCSQLRSMGLSGRKVPPSNTSSTPVCIENDADEFNVAEEDNPHVVMDGLDLANCREALANLQASFTNRKWLRTRRFDFDYLKSIDINARPLFQHLVGLNNPSDLLVSRKKDDKEDMIGKDSMEKMNYEFINEKWIVIPGKTIDDEEDVEMGSTLSGDEEDIVSSDVLPSRSLLTKFLDLEGHLNAVEHALIQLREYMHDDIGGGGGQTHYHSDF